MPFTADRDDEVRRAHNACFTEHHGSSERDPATWQSLFTGQRAFRPDLSVLALEDDVVVGYVLSYIYEADTKATGRRLLHLGQIGVLPRARGRGVATAVIAAALRAGAENDCVASALDVDSGNVTGALRLYEELGFTHDPDQRLLGARPASGRRDRASLGCAAWSASITPPWIPPPSPARTAPSSRCTRRSTSRRSSRSG